MSFVNRVCRGLFFRLRSQSQYTLLGANNTRNMASGNIVTFDDLKAKLADKSITLIDVREPHELTDDGKIPGSVNIPLGSIEEAFKLPPDMFKERYGVKLPDRSDSMVFSCKAGRRAASAAEKVAPLGYPNAKVYSGSFKDWVERGGPLEK